MTYTWDNNGNASTSSAHRLLNNGVNAYTGVYPEPVEGIPLAEHPVRAKRGRFIAGDEE